jgi:transcriptional regulator with XRE-family HTH domain
VKDGEHFDTIGRKAISKMLWKSRNPLKEWRVRHDMSQADVAALLSMSTRSISGYEQGGIMPSTASMMTFAILFEEPYLALYRRWTAWRQSRRTTRRKNE